MDASQLNQLAIDLGGASAETLVQARRVVQKTCADTKRDAQIAVPVRTGNLRSSIGFDTRVTSSGASGEVGPTAAYGGYVEYGTSRSAPRAYMGPAFDRNAGSFVDAMARLKTAAGL